MDVQTFKTKASDVPWRQESVMAHALWTCVLAEYDSFMQCKLFIYMARFLLLRQDRIGTGQPVRELFLISSPRSFRRQSCPMAVGSESSLSLPVKSPEPLAHTGLSG